MDSKFNQILVLVDYSQPSIHAAEEAALLASRLESEVHLVHISAKQDVDIENEENGYYEKVEKLDKIKAHLKKAYGVQIKCHLGVGEFYETLKKYVQDLKINLIVVGAKRKHWLKHFLFEGMTEKIIRSVRSGVLSVYPKRNPKKLKKIVLPIGEFVPEKGLNIAYDLAKKFGANLHLISVTKSGDGSSLENKNLLTSYFLMKEFTNMPVECKSISASNLAEATLNYANGIDADIILMDNGNGIEIKGGKLPKWKSNLVSRSLVPVLNI